MDEIAVVTTLLLYLPIGLITCFQVAEVGRHLPWRKPSQGPSPRPDMRVTNRNDRRDEWVQTSRSCASLSLL
jgi:hypothetical protein